MIADVHFTIQAQTGNVVSFKNKLWVTLGAFYDNIFPGGDFEVSFAPGQSKCSYMVNLVRYRKSRLLKRGCSNRIGNLSMILTRTSTSGLWQDLQAVCGTRFWKMITCRPNFRVFTRPPPLPCLGPTVYVHFSVSAFYRWRNLVLFY